MRRNGTSVIFLAFWVGSAVVLALQWAAGS